MGRKITKIGKRYIAVKCVSVKPVLNIRLVHILTDMVNSLKEK